MNASMHRQYVFVFLYGALLASSWWAAAVFRGVTHGFLFIPAGALTVITVASAAGFALENWNK